MSPIAMNLSRESKHRMRPLLTVISLTLAVVSPAFAGIEWGFDNNGTTVAGTSLGSPGSGTATINLGTFSTGWHDGTTIPWNLGHVPGASGLWDLGSAGSIVLNNSSGSGLTTLNVFQWVQPGTYSGSLTVTVNSSSASLLGTSLVGSLTQGAGWYDYTYNLGVALGQTDTVIITAGSGGAIIDRLTVVPEPTTLIAGAILLIPFALSTLPILRRMRSSKSLVAGDSASAASKSERVVSAPKGRT